MKYLILLLITVTGQLAAGSMAKLTAQYESLDPTSLLDHLAFYELYPDTPLGKRALGDAWRLLGKQSISAETELPPLSFPQNIDAFIALMQPPKGEMLTQFAISDEALALIDTLGKDLSARKRAGHHVESLEEAARLPVEEIDLAHALFIGEFGNSPEGKRRCRLYEAALDLMALQIRARVRHDAPKRELVRALNQLVFHEMGFRFPPHSRYSKEIDRFTFLQHILESRRGVCLGVSTLYLCLAQRLDLSLEIFTPPGHIFLGYRADGVEQNIETTIRGTHIPTEEYLELSAPVLQPRTIKEVVGMTYYNHAALWLHTGEWQKAFDCYEKALPFMPDDADTITLSACTLLLLGRKEEALSRVQRALATASTHPMTRNPIARDLLNGKVAPEALQATFLYVDETRASLLRKKDALIAALSVSPEFRQALFQLAITWLQLSRPKEAIDALERLHEIDPDDIDVEYYLASLFYSRYDIPKAEKHYRQALRIAKAHAICHPSLTELKLALAASGRSVAE